MILVDEYLAILVISGSAPDALAGHEVALTDGAVVLAAIHVLGYVVSPVPMPPLDVLASPGFEWPDADIPIHGAGFIETADDHFAAARATVYGWSGTVNVASGTIRVSARAITQLLPASAALSVSAP